MALTGVDISHYQNDAGLDLPRLLAAVDFVIVKATQGTSYTDPKFAGNIAALRSAGKLRGIYHFAGATGQVPGDPTAEADYFIAQAQPQPGEVLVLDWEPTAPPADPDAWCAAFLTRVKALTGRIPVVYMSEAVTRQGTWAKTRAIGPGLWVARYGPNNGTKPAITLNVGPWGGYAMWQYTSNGRLPGATGVIDVNEFYGDPAAWLAYGGLAPTSSNPTPQEDDMPLDNNDWTFWNYGPRFREDRNYAQVIHNIEDQATAANTQLAGLTAAVSKLADAVASGRDDLTADQLKQAVRDAMLDAGSALRAAQAQAAPAT